MLDYFYMFYSTGLTYSGVLQTFSTSSAEGLYNLKKKKMKKNSLLLNSLEPEDNKFEHLQEFTRWSGTPSLAETNGLIANTPYIICITPLNRLL